MLNELNNPEKKKTSMEEASKANCILEDVGPKILQELKTSEESHDEEITPDENGHYPL